MANRMIDRSLSLQMRPTSEFEIKSHDLLDALQMAEAPMHLIRGFQNIGSYKFIISFDKEQDMDNFIDWFKDGSSIVPDITFQLDRANQVKELNRPADTKITIYGAPYELDPKFILSNISAYCTSAKIKRCTWRGYPNMYNGVHLVFTPEIKKPIPSHINIKGIRISVKYEDQPQPSRRCFKCGEEGHLAASCPSISSRSKEAGLDTSPVPIERSQDGKGNDQPPTNTASFGIDPPVWPSSHDITGIMDESENTDTIDHLEVITPLKTSGIQSAIHKNISSLASAINTIRKTSTPNSSSAPKIADAPQDEWQDISEEDYNRSKEEMEERQRLEAEKKEKKKEKKVKNTKNISGSNRRREQNGAGFASSGKFTANVRSGNNSELEESYTSVKLTPNSPPKNTRQVVTPEGTGYRDTLKRGPNFSEEKTERKKIKDTQTLEQSFN